MKLRLFATAALAAAALSAPALAQDVTGSVGVNASHTEAELGGLEGEGETYGLDGSVAIDVSDAWTVTLQGAAGAAEGDLGDDDAYSVGAALTYAADDWRVGPTVSYSDASGEDLWTVGVAAQKYLGKVTLAGAVNYGTIDDDVDLWSLGGEVRYFVTDNFRVDGGVSWATAKVPGADVNGWNVGVDAEYQFAGTPWSITGGYSRSQVEDVDLDVDTFAIGFRYSFGGDLKARDRSGADLGAGGNPFAVGL